MGSISRAIVRFFLQGDLLERFEEKVENGKTTSIDVFLQKEKGYIVKGEILKRDETPIMSLRDASGNEVPAKFSNNGQYFSVTPDRDGPYNIQVAVRSNTNGRGPVATVVVSLLKQIELGKRGFY
ncbi:MAG: hypothetical protein A4E64_00999 [Syntrophorhabdus sp. PtaU1.Bin058]|nr:MAG: hypothetical protein A4E64_00999 [Syntrophorhabdus sp. PtaU1.Bin058]